MHIQGGMVPVKMSTIESIKAETERRGEGTEKRREVEGGEKGREQMREKRREREGREEGREKREKGEGGEEGREERTGGERGKRRGEERGKRKGGERDRGIIDHAQGAERDIINTHEIEAAHMKGATDIKCNAYHP